MSCGGHGGAATTRGVQKTFCEIPLKDRIIYAENLIRGGSALVWRGSFRGSGSWRGPFISPCGPPLDDAHISAPTSEQAWIPSHFILSAGPRHLVSFPLLLSFSRSHPARHRTPFWKKCSSAEIHGLFMMRCNEQPTCITHGHSIP